MTASRETGGEGRIEELEQMVFAMMATDSLGNVVPADAPEANRRLTAYRDALLATPRPVEVTEEIAEAWNRAADAVREAIGALPLPWGAAELDAPLARVGEAIDNLQRTAALLATPRPVEVMEGVEEAVARARWEWEDNAVRNAPELVRRLGARLADLLDADHWNGVEPMLVQIAAALRARPFTGLCDVCGKALSPVASCPTCDDCTKARLRAQPAGGTFPAVRDLGTIEFNDGMDDTAPVADAGGTRDGE